ncbi:MAG TPA: LPS export ABC transporter ATP-binding protein [Phycisphaerae bacterium]|jgi:lipopolysaccharide export system ATP-binding protein|nr:LPS export ABC transporter ATP-binding protein [Phycisphaerae bacterium]HOB74166.1 LPS export ABC transporter ATP-binding protein [Phycisphaerae bacterium]HOJ55910.1 LPS export ABC transporter ATP-binding protein [Phycisphaerae bacterium]HOL27624.1 LPS export ABC transporter ATP-binding protein [Phycisphaerae bacterium]HPP22174.1 LPS export ABC transporter ATP-binding protein [Phycisphaerae bacterium]
MPKSAKLLETIDLVKRYGSRTVVDRVSYCVKHGEIVGLLGRNGAGKTTSFRITIGMITPNAGKVIFNGEDIADLPMYKRAQRGIGYLSQEPSVFQRLTVRQNLLAILEGMPLRRRERHARADNLLDSFGLLHLSNQLARSLSGGERRRLEIARALITEPQLILLDEPFSGVDPIAVEGLQREITRLRSEHGIAILLTDHNVRETLSVTDRSYIIHEGQVIAEGTPRDLINDPKVRRIYLGNTFRGDEFDEPESTSRP